MKRISVNVDGVETTLDIKMSHSFANNAACPLYLKLHYVDRVSDRYVRVAAERGKGAHDAISNLIHVCREEEIQPDRLHQDQITEAVATNTPQVVMSEMGLVMEWVKLWAERYKISRNYYGHEEKLAIDDEFDECEWGEASYRGILDVVDIDGRFATTTDWKSQPHIIAQGELDNPLGYGVPEQMTNYCWLLSKFYPQIDVYKARIWYLRYGFYHETTRTREDLELFEQALMAKEQKISEIDNWDPVPGKHCQYCDFVHMCPLANDLSLENNEVITQDQAVQAAQRVHVMDSLSKMLKEKLKDYVNGNDEVVYGDNFVYGFNKKESSTWPADKLGELLEDNEDHALSDLVNVDVKKAKKLIKTLAHEDPVLCDKINDIKKTKRYTRFEGYHRGPKEE